MADRCPICGELPTSAVPAGTMSCIITGGDRCVRLGFERLERLVKVKDAELAEKNARLLELEGRINTPYTGDWFDAVRLEAAHQIGRWGTEHDAGKAPADWFWLLGYLGGKALASAIKGDVEKAKHHTISSGAVLLNWFRHMTGDSTVMRPGISDPEVDGG